MRAGPDGSGRHTRTEFIVLHRFQHVPKGPRNSLDHVDRTTNSSYNTTTAVVNIKYGKQQRGSTTTVSNAKTENKIEETTATKTDNISTSHLRVVLEEPESSAQLPIRVRLQPRQPGAKPRRQPRHEVAFGDLHHRHLRGREPPRKKRAKPQAQANKKKVST